MSRVELRERGATANTGDLLWDLTNLLHVSAFTVMMDFHYTWSCNITRCHKPSCSFKNSWTHESRTHFCKNTNTRTCSRPQPQNPQYKDFEALIYMEHSNTHINWYKLVFEIFFHIINLLIKTNFKHKFIFN